MKEQAPKEFQELIGTKQKLRGGVFGKKSIEPTEFNILDWRWGSGQIMDMNTLEVKHPTIELLLKNDTMKASRWSRGFPVRSIDLTKEKLEDS